MGDREYTHYTRQDYSYYRKILQEGGSYDAVPQHIRKAIAKQDVLLAKEAKLEALSAKVSADRLADLQARKMAEASLNKWGQDNIALRQQIRQDMYNPAEPAPAPVNSNQRYCPTNMPAAKAAYKKYWADPDLAALVQYGQACGSYRHGKYASVEEQNFDYNRTLKALHSPEAMRSFDDDGQVRKKRMAAVLPPPPPPAPPCQCLRPSCKECDARFKAQVEAQIKATMEGR